METWGLRGFAVLGACRVQALELQVSLQHWDTQVWLSPLPAVSASAFGQEVVLVLCHRAGRQDVSRDMWLECHRVCSVTEPWEGAPGTKAWQGCAQGFSQLQSALGRALGGMGTEGWCPCGSKGYVWWHSVVTQRAGCHLPAQQLSAPGTGCTLQFLLVPG